MQMATTLRRSSQTCRHGHLIGPGLDDDRYLVERLNVDGRRRDMVRRRCNGASKKVRGKEIPAIMFRWITRSA